MTVLRIEGGTPLSGVVDVPGSKNASLAILSSVLLASGPVTLRNVPRVSDVFIKLDLLRGYGAKIDWEGENLVIDSSELVDFEPTPEMTRLIRTSFYLLGPILARLGRARLPMPGGCQIGARPVDYHLKGLTAMGAKIDTIGEMYVVDAPRLVGTEIYLDFPSAGATQHLMATATLAEGITVIENAAMEPEVTSLADFLVSLGARIEGAGTSTITIQGKEKLTGSQFFIPADRLQAGTFLLGAAITQGDVTVRGVLPEHQTAVVNKLREAGAKASEGPDWVRVSADRRLRGIRVKTMPYPGFPTDVQQPMAAVLAMADGLSTVNETIYESRTGHIGELNRMGAKMTIEGRTTIIEGVAELQGAKVVASDLRAGAALVLAGLAAKGVTEVRNVHFIDRGYEGLESLLTHLGGRIQRIQEKEPIPLA
ncbi:MAG: UDP-N-acetylglucosamine 1-carboxyvinyltransferase [Fimbriimonadaceae bacterium]|jgi:UDP-N-acetylglucosamine 1-carboxyvinyltransferase|nr:UDP-N-acetylglucosamine 1-carboxyvinyltransferase [Fimbriimonadaceae bacterium]